MLASVPADAFAVVAALADLVLPARCAGCRRPAAPLCDRCARGLDGRAWPAWPSPCPPGLPPPWAVAAYEGSARAAVLAYKEHGRVSLAAPLGRALATALRAAAAAELPASASASASGAPGRPGLVAVPVPSSPTARRARGDDPLLRLTRRAAALAGREGLATQVRPVLAQRRAVADQAGLDASRRAANLRGALAVPAPLVPLVHGRTAVLCDDVITTGATLAEAARALRAAGAHVAGAALVAATQRRGGRLP